MTIALIIAGAMVYGFMIGVTRSLMSSWISDAIDATACSFFWPAVLPIAAGVWVGDGGLKRLLNKPKPVELPVAEIVIRKNK